ncbi:MAG: NAD(P)H-hydrate dehydratase [Oscillospiraceae bacterium]|nr:NAD(P)H-hydrate dehydratase [Oscillospiraceae bacterium]
MKEILKEEIIIPTRKKESHKGSYGRLLIIAGSENYPGAAALSTLAALRSGAGIVTLLSSERVISKIFPLIPEAVLEPMEKFNKKIIDRALMRSTAVVIGPGLGGKALKTVKYVLKNYKGPLLLDADGINALKGNTDILKIKKGPMVLTPHPGEMARLLGKTVSEIEADREGIAADFSKNSGAHLVLKGHKTIVSAPSGEMAVNTTGNAGMARGGSGDVLSGILGAFLSLGEDIFSASKKAVFLHGLAGDIAAEEKTEHAMLPRDIIEAIPKAFKRITE